MTANENNTTSTLSAKLTGFVDRLAQATDQALAAAEMQKYLQAAARFHHYSWGNQLLIYFGNPNASQVAGYQTWRALGRQVRKGEKGLAILAPVVVKGDDDETQARVFFKTVHVFDIGQTDGDALPEQPDWKSRAQDGELAGRLAAFAQARGIQVSVENLPGETQGVSRGGSIGLSSAAGTKTLIHELAHELLHQHGAECSRAVMELQAESVAYVVALHFGLGAAGSPNYLALWGATSQEIRASLSVIQSTAAAIIDGLAAQPAA